jgi:fucose 4-O-acetylase-like acetyltransferase
MTTRDYRPGLDWLKAIGMTLILLGHLAGAFVNHLTPPIYPKQLGVAFFIFAMGYSLSSERRSSREVVYNRLFEVFLWGLALAVVVTVASGVTTGHLELSNYLPFLVGSNVLLNNFPANPTTWYVGTYIHLLLLWSLTRRIEITPLLLIAVLVFEIGCRVLLMGTAGLFVAYMALPNWLLVFMLGRRAGERQWVPAVQHRGVVAVLAIVVGVLYYYAVSPLFAIRSFPFMIGSAAAPWSALLATSCLVTTLYTGWTYWTGWFFAGIPTPSIVRFVARNTLLVFLAHMPVFYWIDPHLQAFGLSYNARSLIDLTICFPGLAALSEAMHHLVPVRRWREMSREILLGASPSPVASSL